MDLYPKERGRESLIGKLLQGTCLGIKDGEIFAGTGLGRLRAGTNGGGLRGA